LQVLLNMLLHVQVTGTGVPTSSSTTQHLLLNMLVALTALQEAPWGKALLLQGW
jgi:hypothetical protein